MMLATCMFLRTLQKTVDMTRLVVEDILAAGKIPVALGGEHTVTLGVAKGLGAGQRKRRL